LCVGNFTTLALLLTIVGLDPGDRGPML
jgi:hypothetical protein